MNRFTENEKDYPEKGKKKDEEEKISDTTNTFIKKSQIALNYDIKKIYA